MLAEKYTAQVTAYLERNKSRHTFLYLTDKLQIFLRRLQECSGQNN